ncbi:MAG: SDR family oxidoreductase, partial [Candidatus Neomarinimicrobiota bacterium]|nr:SDR family oxidoreductase [Candidatus Neomarinimicrobiota bacterium]
MKTILVTGSYGQLGVVCTKYLKKYFNIYGTGRSAKDEMYQLDISNKQSVEKALARFQPDIILNLAAMTDVDGCENEPKMAEKYNADGIKNLCDDFDGHIIQISTDYVFDGEKGPYTEKDPTNPISVYGRTKLMAEEFLINNNLNYTIIRTNVLYGYDKNTKASFLKWVVNSLQDSRSIKVVKDQWNNPTST